MNRLLFACALALLATCVRHCAAAAGPAPGATAQSERLLAAEPYDFAARSLAVSRYHNQRQYELAYYHAAWLAWLGPVEYRDGATGAAFLLDREHRDRVRVQEGDALAPVLDAVAARKMLLDSCLGGTIAQQAPRLRKEISALLQRAQTYARTSSAAGRRDAVTRMAIVQLALSLDDAALLEGTPDEISRLPALRMAATGAETVAAWLPEAPGVRRTLAVIRARLAALDNRRDLWQMAIDEAERAHALDPADLSVSELLWDLSLRAGDWRQAAAWERRVKAAVPVQR